MTNAPAVECMCLYLCDRAGVLKFVAKRTHQNSASMGETAVAYPINCR